MVNITFFETKLWEEEYLRQKLKKHKLQFIKDPINEKNILKAKDAEIVSTFIYSKMNSDLIQKLPKLKFVATRSTGYDHIDVTECNKRNINVSNVPYYGENTVAEHTFALILSLSRNIHKSYVRTLKNNFSIEGLTGFDLKGKTIGIIGGGHIGLHVARMARAFGMHVRVCDINQQEFLAEVINFKYIPFDELLQTSDIITIHAPYNKTTHHLINKSNIKKIKKGAILINTARGGIIDTDALLFALEKKILAGAALDVIEGEEIIKEEHQLLQDKKNTEKWKVLVRDEKIFKMDNVVFTPHNAFNSKEALLRILDTTIDNINAATEKKYINTIKLTK